MKQKRAGRRKQNQRRWNDKKMIHFFFLALLDEEMWHANYRLIHPFPLWSRGGGGGLARPNTRVRQNSVSSTEVSSFPLFPISLSHLSLSPDRFLLLHLYLLYISPSPPPPPPIHCVCVCCVPMLAVVDFSPFPRRSSFLPVPKMAAGASVPIFSFWNWNSSSSSSSNKDKNQRLLP